ncbi:MAG: phosphoribosylanthranilate isomerase [Ignavibacteriae bacterium]|nr:phosphoribosylanthranilate isomerase [Ignavibacteriota bacterium]NOG98008.1 phosphoribosylanthranilate isomerase [Ignavibacteriota bacterium]
MDKQKKVRFKICCISSVDEANLAIKYGASALGLVSEMPSGPGVISNELIKEIAEQTPPPISTFLLTSKTDAKDIIEQQKELRTNAIQIVDELKTGTYAEIKEALPGITIVQVVHVIDDASVKYAVEVSNQVDALLLDSGNPNLSTKVLGGTGKIHNWEISKKIREGVSIPIFLAGGLNPVNAKSAIETVGPFALDLCSGVRTNGKLDESKLAAFVNSLESN